MTALNGWLVIDKPFGIGSTQVVGAVKRALREGGYAKVKVGHGGTLDPLASGVLPIALGEATKLAGRMLDARKAYDFEVTFGTETAGLDAEGEVVSESDVRPTMAEVEAVLACFTGLIEQVPPAYSALKVDGQRAYDLARRGEAVELAARSVEVFSLAILPGTGRGTSEAGGGAIGLSTRAVGSFQGPQPIHHPADVPPSQRAGEEIAHLTLSATVSKGTYIRSLARDIAYALGTVGHVTMLRRTQAGPFALSQAISLDKLADVAKARSLEEVVLPLEAGLDGIPALSLAPDEARLVRQGRTLSGQSVDDGTFLAKDGAVPVALVEVRAGALSVLRGFNL